MRWLYGHEGGHKGSLQSDFWVRVFPRRYL